jgi:hypothetical protein
MPATTLLALFALVFRGPVQETRPPANGTGGDAGTHCRPARAAVDPDHLPQDRKSVLLRQIAKSVSDSRAPAVGDGQLHDLEARFAKLPPDAPPPMVYGLSLPLGDVRLADGNIEGAIEAFQRCREIADAANDRAARLASMRKLAVAWMRRGERTNCVANHNADSCIFPLKDGALHLDRTGSERASEVLLEILTKLAPNDLSSIWLLNVAQMTLGRWPDGVPQPFRIDPAAFASEAPMPRMFDIAAKRGIDVFTRSGGSCMDDFDGDGRLDILTSSSDPWEPLHLFRQKPDGNFEDVASKVGLDGQLGGLDFLCFDANNDGRLDLLVQRGPWTGSFGRIPNSLLIQQADHSFVDRTLEAGLEVAAPSQVAVTADVDLDGDLDLFLGYESQPSPDGIEFPSFLFRNRGDGTFEDATREAGVQNLRFCKGAAFGDYDGDNYPDLYVSNLGAPNRLYHNNRDGTFTDVAAGLGVAAPQESFACWFFDYNNDGALDLYVTNYGVGTRAEEVCAFYKNGTAPSDHQRLYEGDGKGRFRDVSRERGLARPAFAMGCNFGDIDNDGFPDIYLGTGDPDFKSLWPNVMYRNDSGRRFQDVTAATGTGHLQKGHGVSFGDIDGDGDQDLFEKLGGALKDDAFSSVLFENPGHGHHWLTVQLIGHATNRFGIGVRLHATIEEAGGPRSIYAIVGANSSFGGNSLQAEMGLGRANRLAELEVFWPVTGKTDRFTDVPLDLAIVVEEGVGWRAAPKTSKS